MKKLFFIALMFLAITIVMAQTVTNAETDFMTTVANLAVFGIPVIPVIIVIALTQLVKTMVIKKDGKDLIEAPWANIITYGVALILSVLTMLIYSFPGFDAMVWIQKSLSVFSFSVMGYQGYKVTVDKAGTI
jgi:hypothetical protein